MIRQAFARAGACAAHRFWLLLFAILALAACGGSGGPSGPDPDDLGALRLEISFDEIARRGLDVAGFRLSDVERVDLEVAGSDDSESRSLPPAQTFAFLTLESGSYVVTATAYGQNDLVLFTAAGQTSLAARDTVDMSLEMLPQIGDVRLTIDGQASGTVETVAGTEVPFTILVRNGQGRPVPGSTVEIEPADPGFGQALLAGGNATDLNGLIDGFVRAPSSGTIDLTVKVDGRPIADPGATRVVFAPAVNPQTSRLTDLQPTGQLAFADGKQAYTFTVTIANGVGDPLPDTPVTAISDRNAGVQPNVDIMGPAPGYQDGLTDEDGVYKFTVRSFTSSFLRLDEEGRLTSENSGGHFIPSTIDIVADGIFVEERAVTFNSTANPTTSEITTTDQFVKADGSDRASIVVRARKLSTLGGGPVPSAFVEIVSSTGEKLNQALDIRPEAGFSGFRTNGQGEWRGEIRSTEKGAIFFTARVDGRTIIGPLRSIIFQ